MLPVVIIGEDSDRIQHISKSMPMAQTVPLRSIRFNREQDSRHIPALGAPSIMMVDVDMNQSKHVADFIRRLKMTYPDSAILVLVSFGDQVAEQEAIDNGADDVLTRPVSLTRLSLTLRNLSELVSRRTQNYSNSSSFTQPIMRKDTVHILQDDGRLKRLHQIEQEIIKFAVNHCHGHISNTAKALGIGRSTLYRKLDAMDTREKFEQRVLQKHGSNVYDMGVVN